jgi:Ca2+-transporting ATPase
VSSNLSEIWLTLVSVTAGFGSPLSPMQLLWINLITDVFPGLALAAEPPEPEVLLRPPRDPDEAIMHKSDLKQYGLESCLLATGGLAAYGYGRLRYGAGARAGTLAFMSLGLSQLAHTYTCRSDRHGLFAGGALPRNNYLNGAIGISAFFHLATAFVPWLRALLGTTPLSVMDLAVTAGTAIAPYLVNEGVKARTNNEPADRTLLVRTDDPVGPANDVG